MERHTFLLETVITSNTQKKLPRRTVDGKIKAIIGLKFKADGIIEGANGSKEKVENQSFKDLKARGVELIKIPGLKKNLAISINSLDE